MKISIVLAALTGSFETDMNRASKTAQKRMKEIEKTAKEVGAAIGTALVAGASAAAVAIKSAIDRADELSKTAQKIGVTTEALSALAYAAELADVDLGTLQGGLARLTKFQNEAAMGTEKNVALFDALGISFKNLDGSLRNTEDVFRDFAKVFQALPDGANKTALALDVFGKSGANLIPLLNGGADGLDAMREKAERLGIVVSTETGKAAEEFNDRLTDLKLQITGLATAVAVELLPDLNRLTDELQEGTKSGDGFASTAENVANGIRGIAAVAGAAYNTIKLLALGIVNVVAEMSAFAAKYSVLGLLDGGAAAQKFSDIASVTGAGATDAANFFTGNGTTGVNRPGGEIVFEDPPEAKAADAATVAQEAYNKALQEYQQRAEKAAEEAKKLAEQKLAAATASRAASAAEKEAEAQAKAAMEERADAYDEIQRVYKAELKAIADEEEARQKAKEIVDQTLADIAFETKLIGLNNLEREKAIALRYANVEAASAEGQAISAALDELDKAQQIAEGMDVVRGATEGLFSDLIDGSKSAKDAFKDFVDNILAGIAQIVARNLTESLFGSFGSTGGGAAGGGLASLFGAFFGGARASGGPVYPGKAFLVGEQGPELFIPPSAGTIATAGQTARMGRGGVTNNIVFSMPGRYDQRTQAQIAVDVARVQQRNTERGTA